MTSWLTFRQASFSFLCYSEIRHFHCWVLVGRKQIKKHYFPNFFIPGTILLENMKLNKVWNCVNSQRSSNPLFLLMGHQSTGSGIPIYLSFIGARQATIFLHFLPLKKCNISPIYDECQTQSLRVWHYHENGLVKTIQMILCKLFVIFKLASL